jgi:hypothetical protein
VERKIGALIQVKQVRRRLGRVAYRRLRKQPQIRAQAIDA